MPTLQFKGKNIIWNHHLSVPYHSLEEIEDLNFKADESNGNLIVEGDNLLALKALLPKYAGRVKCIYIDPPYNTGNEGWIYNDKVNSPLIQEWLSKEVGRGDLTRHDKWLCMMTPRLKLLRELLKEDGVIFISIDEHEINALKCIMDEIFGEECLVSHLCVLTNPKGRVLDKYFSTNHEYVLVYSKSVLQKGSLVVKKSKTEITKDFPLKDGDGKYRELELRNTHREFGRHNRKKMFYPFFFDEDGNELSLEDNGGIKIEPIWDDGFEGCWTWGKPLAEDNLDLLIARKVKGQYKVYRKAYAGQATKKFKSLLTDKRYHTEKGQAAFNELFEEGKSLFNAPKSVELIKDLIRVSTEENDIILDSFGGSGTTLHAVQDLNEEDGTNRQCVIVQMTESNPNKPDKNICKDVTRERVKRAIEKYGFKSGFKYLRVGSPIDPETMLDGDLPTYQQFAEYVYYLATGGHLADKSKVDASKHFVGMEGDQAAYLIYEQDMEKLTRLALTLQIAESIVKHSPGKRRVVYAPSCFLDEEYMAAMQIEFVSVPYNLFERKNKG